MEFSKSISIRNILTLRFNPEEKPFIENKSQNDFAEENSDTKGVKTERLLDQSILDNLSCYDKICIGNSGGVDSTLLLALLKKNFPNKKLFSITLSFNDIDGEFEKAKYVAKKYNAEYVNIKCNSILDNMEKLTSIVDEPRWNTYVSFVAKKANEVGDVLVTGDGADELFAGYEFRYSKFLQLNITNPIKKYLMCHERDWVVDQQLMFGKQIDFDWEKIFSYFEKFFKNYLIPLKQVLLADYNGKLLRDILPTNELISKKLGVKIFSPFLSSDLIGHATHLPMTELYDGKEGKIILKRILKRKRILINMEKVAFGPNLVADWRGNFKKPSSILLEPRCNIYKEGLINFRWVKKSLHKISNPRYASKLTSVFALEKWLQKQN